MGGELGEEKDWKYQSPLSHIHLNKRNMESHCTPSCRTCCTVAGEQGSVNRDTVYSTIVLNHVIIDSLG